MRQLFKKLSRAVLGFCKRLLLNAPINRIEEIVFDALFQTQAEIKRGLR
jgi:hypothetical protein